MGERPELMGGPAGYPGGPPNPMANHPNFRQVPPEFRAGPYNDMNRPAAPERGPIVPPNNFGPNGPPFNGPNMQQEQCNSSVVMVILRK